MKIPYIEGPSVKSSGPIGPSSPNYIKIPSPARALSEFGASLGAGAQGAYEGWKRYEAEANALAEADATLELQRRYQRQLIGDRSSGGRIEDAFMGTSTEEGFLQSQGRSALEKSAKVLEVMERDRLEVAESISDERTRQRFLVKSQELQLLASRQVEGHVASEYEKAKQATAKGLSDQFLSMSESGAPNFDEWLLMKRNAEERVRALSPSPEAGDAAVKSLQSSGAQAFAFGLLGQGKLDEAKAFVQSQRATLGSKFFETSNAVDAKLAAQKSDRAKVEVAKVTEGWAAQVRDENGFVTEEALRAVAKPLAPEDPLRDEAEVALERQIRVERAKIDATSKQYEGAGKLAIEDGLPIPSEAETFLKRYDPNALAALKARQRMRYVRWKSDSEGRRKQAAADKVFLNELETALTLDPNLDPAEFEKDWIAKREESGSEISVPSEVASSSGRLRGAKKEVASEKGEATFRKSLAARFESTFRTLSKTGKKIDQAALNERVGEALKKYDQKVQENGGRPLSEDQITELEAQGAATIIEPGFLWGTKRLGVDVWKKERTENAPKTVQMRDPKTGRTFDVPSDRVEEARRRKGLEINAR